jgi:hypothetical protein
MIKSMMRVPSPALVIAIAALFVALGGTSYAVISSSTVPDSHGVFHACVNKSTGAIRIITASGKCHKAKGHGKHKRAGELAVHWSQTGPPGTNGTNATVNGVAAGGALAGAYPNPRIADGAVIPASIGSIPAAVVTNTGDTPISDSFSHDLNFDTNQVNIYGVHSTAVNTSRLTAPIDGLYEVHGEINWRGCTASGGFAEAEIFLNDLTRLAVTATPVTSTACTAEGVNALVHLHAGDYVTLAARQTTLGSLTVTGTTTEGEPDTPEFDMHWVGPSS